MAHISHPIHLSSWNVSAYEQIEIQMGKPNHAIKWQIKYVLGLFLIVRMRVCDDL